MATPIRPFEANGVYHIFNRGNHKQPVFYDADDYCYFLEKLAINCQKYEVCIYAYCLLKNHYHLLLHQENDSGITEAMHATTVSYVKRFNIKYKTVGRLFQERFRSIPVVTDEQLLQVSKYIHRNPADFTDYASYRWSSYKLYSQGSSPYCDPRPVLDVMSQFGGEYAEFVDATPGVDQVSYPRGSIGVGVGSG